jgi:hypothetical protein
MDHDLHLEADLFFGPCNDPNCPGAVLASRESRPDLAWPTRDHLRLIEDADQ